MTKLSRSVLQQMPKVLLHDHLDGGLRAQTVIDLAKASATQVDLPSEDAQELAEWFFRGANKGNLAEYLEGFAVTCGVMQSEAALHQVAYELIEDLAAENVVYTEVRFAPFLHTNGGLNTEQVMSAVLSGLEEASQATGTAYGVIVCSLRNMSPELSLAMAELAVAFRNHRVVGFDLAGDEFGHPPKAHLDAFHYCQRQNFKITIHAGEAFGKASIWQALQYCGAHRIGHCTKLAEDMDIQNGEVQRMGSLARYIRDCRIPLEICLQSNVHTGAVDELADHPFRYLFNQKFRVTLNTDNRLMSQTDMTSEYAVAAETFGLDARDLEKITVNAMKSAFISYNERLDIIYQRIKTGYADLRNQGII